MTDNLEAMKQQIKENITEMIESNKLQEAHSLITSYSQLVQDDPEIYSIQSVLAIHEGRLEDAKEILNKGLVLEKDNFDLLYNLAYIYEIQQDYIKAFRIYKQLEKVKADNANNIRLALERIEQTGQIDHNSIEEKIAFICMKGLDSFINDIIGELAPKCDIKKFIINNEQEIYNAIDWADTIWLEWGNETTVLATKYAGIVDKKVIVRIIGYEVFSDIPSQINWYVVDRLVFIAEHKRDLFFQRFGEVIAREKTCLIRCGVDTEKFTFRASKTKNKNIAVVGFINYRKGLDLLLQFFYDLLQKEPEYKLFIRGDHQDLRYKIAIDTMINELNLNDKVEFVGRVDNLNDWFKDKTFIVSASIEESFHYSVAEGMLAGLKPVVHAWKESRDLWPNESIFRNSQEFQKIILEDSYEPEKYRQFVLDRYALETQVENICKLLNSIEKEAKIAPIPAQPITLEYLKENNDLFIPYTSADITSYNFRNGVRILIGKKERVSDRLELIEFIIENSLKKKLLFMNIWYDSISGKITLPAYLNNKKNASCIMKLIKEVCNLRVEYCNNIGGFVFDDNIREDIEENSLAYSWESGIPATQFIPALAMLKIIERYKFAKSYIKAQDIVLEAASGFGYGAAFFSKICSKVYAVDIAQENIEFAKSAYDLKNIVWQVGDVTALPYDDYYFDIYISFETFEHLPLEIVDKYFSEAVRVLKKGGKMLISTPNREMRKHVHNPFHIKEYSFSEFDTHLKKYFSDIAYASVMNLRVEKGFDERAVGMVAVCTKQ